MENGRKLTAIRGFNLFRSSAAGGLAGARKIGQSATKIAGNTLRASPFG